MRALAAMWWRQLMREKANGNLVVGVLDKASKVVGGMAERILKG